MAGSGRVFQILITEVTTEAASAEIAVWVLGVVMGAIVWSVLAQWWMRRRGNDQAHSLSFTALRSALMLSVFFLLAIQVSESV